MPLAMPRLAAPSARLYANMRGSVEIVGAAYVHVQETRSGREARLTGVFCTASGLRGWALKRQPVSNKGGQFCQTLDLFCR